MAQNKKSFIAYSDWKDTFDALPDDKAGLLIKHIFAYVNDENPITKDILVNAVFQNIKNALKRDLEKWDKQYSQRVLAGKKSAEVRKRNATTVNERSISSTDSVNVSVSVNDTVTVSDKGTVKVKDNINNNFLSEIKISDVEDKLKDYFEIAKAFQGLFIKNLTEKNSSCVNQKNAKFSNYVDPIRLMMTKDEITKEQLTSVFKYLDSPQGEFWKPNILSTTKLREKFQQLIMKANEKSKTGQSNTVGNTGVSAEYLQQLRSDLQS